MPLEKEIYETDCSELQYGPNLMVTTGPDSNHCPIKKYFRRLTCADPNLDANANERFS